MVLHIKYSLINCSDIDVLVLMVQVHRVGGCITRGVSHEGICGRSAARLPEKEPFTSLTMDEPHLLFSLKPAGLFEHFGQTWFPGSKKHEPKLCSALHADPAGLKWKTSNTQFAFRVCKPVFSRLISKLVYSQVV